MDQLSLNPVGHNVVDLALRRRRPTGTLTCRWRRDASTGALTCVWTARRAGRIQHRPVLASDSEAIQNKPQSETSNLDRFALLAMTERAFIY
jgi:hypothetical protein